MFEQEATRFTVATYVFTLQNMIRTTKANIPRHSHSKQSKLGRSVATLDSCDLDVGPRSQKLGMDRINQAVIINVQSENFILKVQ